MLDRCPIASRSDLDLFSIDARSMLDRSSIDHRKMYRCSIDVRPISARTSIDHRSMFDGCSIEGGNLVTWHGIGEYLVTWHSRVNGELNELAWNRR